MRLATQSAPHESWQDLLEDFRGPMRKLLLQGDIDAYTAGYDRFRRRANEAAANPLLAADLAAKCDVVVENFRPGELEKWGLGYAQLSARNSGLVMVRISGFGQDGPYSQRAGNGVISEAVSGLRHLAGDEDRPPSRVAMSMTDYITGLYAAFGATMALLARGKAGRGQCIDAALYECAFSFMKPWIPAYQKLGPVANRCGSRLPESTPNNLFLTAKSRFIHVTAMGDTVFRRLVQAIGLAALADDERFRAATAPVSALARLRPACQSRNPAVTRWTMRSTGVSSSGRAGLPRASTSAGR